MKKQTQNNSQNSDKIDTMSATKLPSNLKYSDSRKGCNIINCKECPYKCEIGK